jgi:cysteine synthase A
VVEAIGWTPLVRLDRFAAKRALPSSCGLLAKCDYLNPGHSKKDRIARQIIEDAEREGKLRPHSGQSVIELTSGNTGTGLAIVCGVRGYHFIAVMSAGNSKERAQMMRALGAEVVLVPQAPNSRPGQVTGADIELVEQATQKLALERNAFRADQFNNRGNFRAHYLHTGPELWEQAAHQIHAFVDFVGSAGTFAGVAQFLKEQNKEILCYVVEPEKAAILATNQVQDSNHRIQGGGYSMDGKSLPLLNKNFIDGYLKVSDEEVIETGRLLARTEGIFAGFSAAANLCAAEKLIKNKYERLHNKNVVFMMSDSGMKYLSTDLWECERK